MTTAIHFWDRIAPKYARSPIRNMDAYEQTMARTRNYLSRNDRVLEIGCGTGSTALLLAKDVAEVVATDFSASMIEIGEDKRSDQGIANVTFRQAPAVDSVFEAENFDAVLGFNLLHLLQDPTLAARRAHEVLKPGGMFITKTSCLAQSGWHLRAIIGVMRFVGYAPFVNFLSKDALETQIRDAGFEIVETGDYPARPPNHFVVVRKM
ncbi:MAG: class I SAM-dependent methyltransferase [Pseudomonadota bacterium]